MVVMMIGLVSRVVPADETLDAALNVAKQICAYSKPIGTHSSCPPRYAPTSIQP